MKMNQIRQTRVPLAAVLVIAAVSMFTIAGDASAQAGIVLRADEAVRDLGVERYEVCLDCPDGNEIADRIELCDPEGASVGRVVGGTVATGLHAGDIFAFMEQAGQPTLVVLARDGHTRVFLDGSLLSHFVPDPTTGGIVILEDNGFAAVSGLVNRFTAILDDAALRRVLERGFEPPTESALEGGEGELDDCPGWVVVSSCVGCALCAPAGEIPPPCWAACATCTYCAVTVLENSETSGHICGAPCPDDLPHCGGSFCFAEGTLVHTPAGPRAIESLGEGDEVYSAEPVLGRVVVRRVQEVVSYSGGFPLVGVSFGERGDPVFTTPGHHFLTANGWAQAEELSAHSVATRSGRHLAASLEGFPDGLTMDRVYNLVLNKSGGIFVGIDGVYASTNSSESGDS